MSEFSERHFLARYADLGVEVVGSIGREWRIDVDAERCRELLARLADGNETAMSRLVDLTAVDRGPGFHGRRIEVVYRLASPDHSGQLRVHARCDESVAPESVVSMWPAAAWLEREVYEFFGIAFRGHPDLRPLMLEPEFVGHPLRKDYPRQPDLALPKSVV